MRSPAAGIFVDPKQGLMIRFENRRERKATDAERATMLAALRAPLSGVPAQRSVDCGDPYTEFHGDLTNPAERPAVAQGAANPADEIIGQIEERFPDWRGFRDLVDCIDVTLHRLRGGS